MSWNNKAKQQSAQVSGIEALLSESRRLLEKGNVGNLSLVKPNAGLSPDVKEIFENLSKAILSYQDSVNYDIMKYQLQTRLFARHCGTWR